MADGFVFKAVRGLWYVETEDGPLGCTARGKLRTEHQTPLVGDRVAVKHLGSGKGSLEEIYPRKNSFIRPALVLTGHIQKNIIPPRSPVFRQASLYSFGSLGQQQEAEPPQEGDGSVG